VNEAFDIVVAGGGLVGAAFALGLRDSGLRIALIEARATGSLSDDARAIAVSHGSRMILERLGVWPALASAATPITCISVTQQNSFGRVDLLASKMQVPALGYVIAHAMLDQTLAAALEATGVRVLTGHVVNHIENELNSAVAVTDTQMRLAARLIVAADGGGNLNSTNVRAHDYGQSAVVCSVTTTQAHHNRTAGLWYGQ
jgi:2-octaprenyl-6-methoxyphenol hydroxylase